jgi:putative membrane protein
MKVLLRWIANSIAFYLALYLLDSLVAPRFWLQAVWVPVIVAVFLALIDSLIRPLHRLRTRPYRALVMALFTLFVNALVLQIFVWAGASLATTSPVWVLVAAVFLGVLGGVINWLIGFRVKEKPGAVASRATERGTRGGTRRDAR